MKKTQLDRAIEQLEGERAVIDLAIAKLRAQQEKKSTPRAARRGKSVDDTATLRT